ncbi:predicted protein [Botrytis cinerea T4]|uniref:Uncharacterized protein n=1 Tax=Botryotinia fuckeliana (strain T4) TaxID=999810 RepID=G2YWU6_BOTF4|nr:predicted protein [Botrytis cinerea T4]
MTQCSNVKIRSPLIIGDGNEMTRTRGQETFHTHIAL